jgi:DNA-directed RNA polymerase subunit beta'
MSTGEGTYDRINDYEAVKISLASPHDIRSWSFGEVKKPETINYRTYRPEKDGLFCERIFGPEKDWECACGKYRGMKYKGMICDRCGVKVTHSRVRRKRMGHIELAAPVVHIWFFKAMPSRLGSLLDMKTTSLEKVIYFQDYVVVDPKDTPLKERQLLTEEEKRKAELDYGIGAFDADMGAEAIRKLLLRLELVSLSKELREDLNTTGSKQKQKEYVKRLKIIESLRDSDNKPEWMVLDVIPVIPPDLRPLVLLDSGNFATSDLNDLYRRIINRNNRLKKLVDLNAPDVIIRNEKRMLQQSVDALFDNNRCKRPVLGNSNRPLKSLTDMIKGKQGRFRENLLGKRVDYSARSVIVVGPKLLLHQCGLPKRIALELYQPFIIRRLKELGHADTIKSAKKMLERGQEEVFDILEEVTRNHPVLLNRAPTLHRMGIQAFEPVLIEGNAIQLHPLVCKGFNADFDGDQMAVHLPLSIEAQVEAHTLMMSTNNIFSPANGAPIITPSQDIVMGCYYLTMSMPDQHVPYGLDKDPETGELKRRMFANTDEVFMAYQQGKLHTHTPIRLRVPKNRRVRGEDDEVITGGVVDTTVGRVIFNDMLPTGMDFYNESMRNKVLSKVISDCYQTLGRRSTINLLDRMNQTGFKASTRSGLSFGIADLITPDAKHGIIERAEKDVLKSMKNYQRGVITGKERYNKVIDAWTTAREEITDRMMEALKNDYRHDGYVNPIYLMANSGARGGKEQIRQLAGMRGLMAKPNGDIIETPIKANFREGLSVLEYFSSTHGARKGLADTALKTADSGYLTRKLADVAQNVVITTHDCGTTLGVTKSTIYRNEKVEVALADSIRGRVARHDIKNALTGEPVVQENEIITHEIARKIEQLGIDKIQVRSPMVCEAGLGVCRLCYGMDLSTGSMVEEGMAVGIIAAQSIGEPGTQLTMRTFHIGGTVTRDVVSNEIKSIRPGAVRLAKVKSVRNEQGHQVVLGRNGQIALLDETGSESEKYDIPIGSTLFVAEGDTVPAGTKLCEWDPHASPILSTVGGKVRFEDLIDDVTLRVEVDKLSGMQRRYVMELKGDRHPQIIIEDEKGSILDFYYIPEKASLEVSDGDEVKPGRILAKIGREASRNMDIVGGLPRVTEIFEARKPRDPAIMAEVDGKVELLGEKRRGKRTIVVRSESGQEFEHLIPQGKSFKVHSGDFVVAGTPLVEGPLVPHDILRINGEEAVQEYLTREVQNVYRSQRVEIDDKHIETIIAQMLRKVKISHPGDTGLLPGSVVDKFVLRRVNDELMRCVKITDAGDTNFTPGSIVPKDHLEQINVERERIGGTPAKGSKPQPAGWEPQLLGITKASVQSESFISAASFQETTKVLTEAALAGKVDRLVGLKENVILGHLVPAGTGFKSHQQAEWRARPEALEALSAEKDRILARHSFPLMEDRQQEGEATEQPSGDAPTRLETLLGGGD